MTDDADDVDVELDSPEPPTDPGPDGSPPSRTVPASAFIVAVMASVVLAVVAVVGVLVDGGGGSDPTLAPRQAAGRFAELLFTVDVDHLDDWRATLLASSTGGFAVEFEQVEKSLRTVIESTSLRLEAEANEVFISDVVRGTASAIVVLDYRGSGTGGNTNVNDELIRIELVRVDGVWLVDNVATVGGASPLGGLGGGG